MSLRVVTYNVHSFTDSDGAPSLREVAALLGGLKPDLVSLNEVERAVRAPGGGCPLEYLGEAAGCPHVSFAAAEWGTFGNAVLSRFPLLASTRVCLKTQLDKGRRLGRSMAWTEADTSGREGLPPRFGFGSLHLDYRSEVLRCAQAARALDFTRQGRVAALPHALAGDLNCFRRADYTDAEWARIVKRREERRWEAASGRCAEGVEAAGYRDLFADTPPELRSREKMTAHTRERMYRIDYVLASRACRARAASYRVVECGASDHLPVVADLQFGG